MGADNSRPVVLNRAFCTSHCARQALRRAPPRPLQKLRASQRLAHQLTERDRCCSRRPASVPLFHAHLSEALTDRRPARLGEDRSSSQGEAARGSCSPSCVARRQRPAAHSATAPRPKQGSSSARHGSRGASVSHSIVGSGPRARIARPSSRRSAAQVRGPRVEHGGTPLEDAAAKLGRALGLRPASSGCRETRAGALVRHAFLCTHQRHHHHTPRACAFPSANAACYGRRARRDVAFARSVP